MKKFTRVLAPVLALSLAASLFTGCGSKAEETQAAATETKAEAQAEAKTEENSYLTERPPPSNISGNSGSRFM